MSETPSGGDPLPTAAGPGPDQGDFFALLFDSTSKPDVCATVGSPAAPGAKRLTTLQKGLMVLLALAVGALTYATFRKILSATGPAATRPLSPAAMQSQEPAPPTAPQPPAASASPGPSQTAEPIIPDPEPLSLQIAEKLYTAGDVQNALAAYDQLHRRLPATEQNQPVRDFLLLRMALCSRRAGNAEQADNTLRAVALSRLPVLRALARYHQSVMLMHRQRYLEAAERAYQTIGLVEVVDYDVKWSAAVQRQCNWLVAEAMTRHALSLRHGDVAVPGDLWIQHADIDPFVGLEEGPLRVFLVSGCERLDEALLSPQIDAAGNKGAAPRWSVTSNGASLDELLARFASRAGLDVQWIENGRTALDEEAKRKRPVYLHLASATAQQVVATAAGGVGLLARVGERQDVSVSDPSVYTSLTEHTELLTSEATLLWQRFLLAAESDQWTANAHFALALLHTACDRLDEAIAEYKLVANRFARHALAPHALLRSGQLKARLRDYVGAHEDLKQLIELYPDTPLSDQACLHLAEATMKAGLYDEATSLYRKVFNLGLSLESQVESALGAGRCFYETQDYGAAATWLNRYITLAADQKRPEFHAACLLLGKVYLAMSDPGQAQAALNLALKGDLSRQQHIETVILMVGTCIRQGFFVEALNLLEGTQAWQLSQEESVELALLRAEALRSIGLTEKAIAILAEKGPFLPGVELKARVALELARCYADHGEPAPAVEALSNAFALVQPGALAQQIGCMLAQLCVESGRTGQAMSVLQQLLNHAEGTDRARVLDLQACVYRMQGQYDNAVAVMLARHAQPTTAPEAQNAPNTR